MQKVGNMQLYEMGRQVPSEALKPFSNGRFSGTDINPMWRIKKLTEMFGPAGIGWYTDVTRQEVIPVDDGNLMVFVDINLYIRDESGEWSMPIFGTGGNTLKVKGRGDDDGFKKAYTDALSIACKALGIGADVWFANDTTSKYSDMYTEQAQQSAQATQRGSKEAAQAAGEKKLEQIKAATGAQMASKAQIEYIKQNSDDETYLKAMQAFGTQLEKMTAKQAEKLIERIKEAS